MTVKEFCQQLRDVLVDLQKRGSEQISALGLIAFLTSVIDNPSTEFDANVSLEQYKAELRSQHERGLEHFRSVILAGQNALRTAFLMNGGAAAAILALVGHLATNGQHTHVVRLSASLGLFVTGVLAAGLASGFTYLSQWIYAESHKAGMTLNILAIVTGLGSHLLFGLGIWKGYAVFRAF